MRLKNESNVTVRCDIAVPSNIPPGAECEVPDGYCRPRRSPNGGRIPSAIEGLAPQLQPADPALRAEWEKVPEPEKPGVGKKLPSKEDFVTMGYPPAVAELMASAASEIEKMPPDERERVAKEEAERQKHLRERGEGSKKAPKE